MQRFLFKSAKVVGTGTKDAWSQVHLFSPDDKKQRRQRGELLAVVCLSGLAEGIEAVASGPEMISRLHEEYYGNLEGGALERLGQAVEKVVAEVTSGAGYQTAPSDKIPQAQIGAAAVVNNHKTTRIWEMHPVN